MDVDRPLGATGLRTHRLGFGGYRILNGNPEHEAALRAYLERGGNLIDTSANYGDGASEELIGKVLRDHPREKAVVVTKGGYIQGRNMELARQRGFPEVVEYGPGVWHSIHPEFLETQIELSLERLGLDFVDVYLLHNPEYFLLEIAGRRALTREDHDEFYRRIGQAFRFLEEQAARGRIRFYGVSSNNFNQHAFPADREPTAMTSVARCLAEAEAVAAGHHFRVVQLPLNLLESGGALAPNNEGMPALAFCKRKGLGALANRPLNAFHGGALIRLADWRRPGEPAPGPERLRELVEPVERLERAFEETFGERPSFSEGVGIAGLILHVVPQIPSVTHFDQLAARHLVEPVQAWLVQARERYHERPEWPGWRDEFLAVVNPLIDELRSYLGAREQGKSDETRRVLREAGYPPTGETLSQMALRTLLSLDGLSGVLAGMRRVRYVEDAMKTLEGPPVAAHEVLSRFSEL